MSIKNNHNSANDICRSSFGIARERIIRHCQMLAREQSSHAALPPILGPQNGPAPGPKTILFQGLSRAPLLLLLCCSFADPCYVHFLLCSSFAAPLLLLGCSSTAPLAAPFADPLMLHSFLCCSPCCSPLLLLCCSSDAPLMLLWCSLCSPCCSSAAPLLLLGFSSQKFEQTEI